MTSPNTTISRCISDLDILMYKYLIRIVWINERINKLHQGYWGIHDMFICHIYTYICIYMHVCGCLYIKIHFDKNNPGTSTTCFWPRRNQERTENIESKSGTQIRNSLVPEKVLMIHRVLIWKRLLFVLLLDRHKAARALGVWCRFDPTKRWP